MSKKVEVRQDCECFAPKRYDNDSGNCQTDGHYLCAGCRHIADFDEMELSDNKERYYPVLYKIYLAELVAKENELLESEKVEVIKGCPFDEQF